MKKQSVDDKMRELVLQEEQIADTIRRQITFTRDYQNIGLQPPRWTNVEVMVNKALITTDREGAKLVINTGTLELFTDLLIEKVYLNLVDNSLRHGGKVTTITFGYQKDGSGLTLVYEDNGKGISDEDKSQIFDRGFGKNTGYGLFLVKEILSITGFTIQECGVYGKGARFEISIPDGSYRFV
jgi:signal transduction histidine kinase